MIYQRDDYWVAIPKIYVPGGIENEHRVNTLEDAVKFIINLVKQGKYPLDSPK